MTIPSIVMLHYVSNNDKLNDLKPWLISKESFEQLLDYIEKERYATVGFEDVKNGNVPQKSIIITFDDCPKHLWNFAIPELQKRKMKAVFYMPTAHLDGHNEWNVVDGLPKIDLMDEQDIRKLVEIGMEVGSHAHNHVMLEDASYAVVAEELTKSKQILENITKRQVISVAYPYGSVPCNYQKIASETGYDFGLSVFSRKETRYSLRRWIYSDEDTVASIKWKMSPMYRIWRAFDDNYQVISKRLMQGLYKRYSNIKKMLINKALLIYTFDVPLEFDMCELVVFCEVI